MQNMAQILAYENSQLQQAFQFSEQDLVENQQGRLSPRQTEYLQAKTAAGARMVKSIGIGVTLLVAVIGVGYSFSTAWWIAPIMIGASALFYVLILLYMRAWAKGAHQRKVEIAEGSVRKETKQVQNMTSYILKLNKQKFYLQEFEFHPFIEGGNYRLFYLKNGAAPLIVAAERLG